MRSWIGNRRWALWAVALLYLAFLLKVILFKYPASMRAMAGSVPLATRLEFSNFVPLSTVAFYLTTDMNPGIAIRNLAGNVIAFVPMGFLLPLLAPRLRKAWHAAGVAFAASLTLELIQLLTGIGAFDVDDLLLNVLGAVAGWCALSVAGALGRLIRPDSDGRVRG